MYVVERVKELIKVRSWQVAPAELEGVLTAHPDIVDAAVIGIHVSEEVELPRAYIVWQEGTNLEAAQVHALSRSHLLACLRLLLHVQPAFWHTFILRTTTVIVPALSILSAAW